MNDPSPSSVLSQIFDGCEGLIEIRPLPPGRHEARFFSLADDADRYARSLDGKVDVYFGAATRIRRSGKKEDVQMVLGVWADCDTPEATAALDTFAFPPSIMVETSPGRVHAYWLFKEPILIEGDGTIATVEGVLRGIADILGSDRAVCEVARIMRVPGTMNMKRNAPCRLLRNDGSRYDLADFTGAGIFRAKADAGNGHPPGRLDTAAVLAGVPEPGRNVALFKLASKLRRVDVPLVVAEEIILKAAANCDPPFGNRPDEKPLEMVRGVYQRYPPRARAGRG